MCPVVIGIGAFVIMRCFEQIRTMVAYNNYNVKLIGLWSGLYYTDQGHTHTLIEDIALMRTLPNTTIYSPSDYKETAAVVYSAIETHGFSYISSRSPFVFKKLPLRVFCF
jgi:transketolase